MEIKSGFSGLLKKIKFFFVDFLFYYFLKIEDKFQHNTKKFYFFAIFFTLIIFSFTFLSPSLSEKKETVIEKAYTVIQSTNLLSINLAQIKRKKIVFRPRLSKEERTSSLSDFVAVAQTIDFNTLLIQTQLNSTSLKKIKDYYQKVLGSFLVKKYFEPDDSYITTGLIQELIPITAKREITKNIRE